jgi:two-component system CheB/CheR fusion protein
MLRLGADTIIRIEEELPRLQSDPTLLRQIFSNLIRNSVKFNKSTVKEVEIGSRGSSSSHCEFYVKDNGIGIDPKYHYQIFKVFERLHSTKDYEGTGIGLAIVKKAVRKLEGSIGIESKVGEGSTFILRIPRLAENSYGT